MKTFACKYKSNNRETRVCADTRDFPHSCRQQQPQRQRQQHTFESRAPMYILQKQRDNFHATRVSRARAHLAANPTKPEQFKLISCFCAGPRSLSQRNITFVHEWGVVCPPHPSIASPGQRLCRHSRWCGFGCARTARRNVLVY